MNREELERFKEILQMNPMLYNLPQSPTCMEDIWSDPLEFAENHKIGRWGEIWWQWMLLVHPDELIFPKRNSLYLILMHELNLKAEETYQTMLPENPTTEQKRSTEQYVLENVVYQIPHMLHDINRCKSSRELMDFIRQMEV